MMLRNKDTFCSLSAGSMFELASLKYSVVSYNLCFELCFQIKKSQIAIVSKIWNLIDVLQTFSHLTTLT